METETTFYSIKNDKIEDGDLFRREKSKLNIYSLSFVDSLSSH